MNKFEDRQHHLPKLLIVLAGYKEVLWEKVFDRLIKYIDSDIDVCVVSSGLYSKKLSKLCKKNKWSYLSTDINNLCLAQNTCIQLHPHAQMIFKMDEDMFVTKDCFKKLFNQFLNCSNKTGLVPSSIVPLINVNTITYYFLLKWYHLLDDFKETTHLRPIITNGLHHHKEILESPEMAKYMWSHFNIDEVTLDYVDMMPTPTRFSIGLIMFPRRTWEDMGHFPVDLDAKEEYRKVGLGEDEKAICVYAMKSGMPMIIDFTTLVGHLAYGPQTKEMINFFKQNQDKF